MIMSGLLIVAIEYIFIANISNWRNVDGCYCLVLNSKFLMTF